MLDVFEVVCEGRRGYGDYPDEWVIASYYANESGQGERNALRTVKRLQTEHPEYQARIRHVRYLVVSQAMLDPLSPEMEFVPPHERHRG